ncbi:hypothetical protein EUTSA_v10013701mg [Eutrema salsugineum]|uniref:Uncharacterized protein n=1 Tax=Eutrema salsugineum TaxID=72664 RepID=V4KZ95_EUTSA|nr:putative FBD-associated F-box protein At5g56700 [Eutrema salsugineum]XP_024012035.1 putative FBD-associated F-box protein At5g56700 [Eutrema salsugineum]ESQ43295.1 hypothetical protein EUTSA_v10013701mg [Eutrema salsugineum]
MDRISGLSDETLAKILSFLPTKVAVSTSILSKRWDRLWLLVPNLDFKDFNGFEDDEDIFSCSDDEEDTTDINRSKTSRLRYYLNKNLPLHKAPTIDSLRLSFCRRSARHEDIEEWVGVAVSRCLRELSIYYSSLSGDPDIVLPSSLYTCKSLVTMKLEGILILVDVPRKGRLPSLKTLQIRNVTYSKKNTLQRLLSFCPVLEDLAIEHDSRYGLAIISPSLQRLSLRVDRDCRSDGYVIDTPSLKHLIVTDRRISFSYSIKHMPKLEEAKIVVEDGLSQFLESITSVKRLSLTVFQNNHEESMYRAGIVFDHLEHLKFSICVSYWSKLLVRLLNDAPKLRVLNLSVGHFWNEGFSWSNERSSVPKCLLKSLETFKFAGYKGKLEERDFLSFLFKNACCLKSPSILS